MRKSHAPLVHKPDRDPGLTLGQCRSSSSSVLAETRGIEQAGSPRQNIPRGQGGCFQNQGQQSPLQNSPVFSLACCGRAGCLRHTFRPCTGQAQPCEEGNSPPQCPGSHHHPLWDLCRLHLDSLKTQGRLRWDERCLEFLRFALYVETTLSNVWHGMAWFFYNRFTSTRPNVQLDPCCHCAIKRRLGLRTWCLIHGLFVLASRGGSGGSQPAMLGAGGLLQKVAE